MGREGRLADSHNREADQRPQPREAQGPCPAHGEGHGRGGPEPRFTPCPGAEGAVDLYLVPAYDDIASLYFEGGQWVIHYAFSRTPRNPLRDRDQALPLSEETIIRVLNSIVSHAA